MMTNTSAVPVYGAQIRCTPATEGHARTVLSEKVDSVAMRHGVTGQRLTYITRTGDDITIAEWIEPS